MKAFRIFMSILVIAILAMLYAVFSGAPVQAPADAAVTEQPASNYGGFGK